MAVRVPAQRDRGQVLSQGPGPCDRPDEAVGAVVAKSHPGAQERALLDDRRAEPLEERRFVLRADQGLIGLAQRPQDAIQAGQVRLRARPLGDLRLQVGCSAGALGIDGGEHDREHRAGDHHERPALDRRDRGEGLLVVDQRGSHAVAEGDPDGRNHRIRDDDATGRERRSGIHGPGLTPGTGVDAARSRSHSPDGPLLVRNPVTASSPSRLAMVHGHASRAVLRC